MLAESSLNPDASDHIRVLDISRDLDQVADLIEMCFPIHSDQDGQTYVKEMRKAARDMRMIGWLSHLSDMGNQKTAGFVWDEGGKIVGNLSLIPFHQKAVRVHLIANVAVHPDHRRKGIARALTDRAIEYLSRSTDRYAWLQVRDDNQPAIDLYQSVGFVKQAVRTTWRIRPTAFKPKAVAPASKVEVRQRNAQDWAEQKKWLEINYPQDIRWNLPVDFRRFETGFFQGLGNFLDGVLLRHWTVELDGQCEGVITWQKTTSFANNLWMAIPEQTEVDLIPAALDHVRKRLPKRHPLSIDYSKGRLTSTFRDLGFEEFRSLIWMRKKLQL